MISYWVEVIRFFIIIRLLEVIFLKWTKKDFYWVTTIVLGSELILL